MQYFPNWILIILPLFQLVIRLSEDNLMAHLSPFLPALLDAFENRSPYVRKVNPAPL
jgi:CLIP-associating protein 1/2